MLLDLVLDASPLNIMTGQHEGSLACVLACMTLMSCTIVIMRFTNYLVAAST